MDRYSSPPWKPSASGKFQDTFGPAPTCAMYPCTVYFGPITAACTLSTLHATIGLSPLVLPAAAAPNPLPQLPSPAPANPAHPAQVRWDARCDGLLFPPVSRLLDMQYPILHQAKWIRKAAVPQKKARWNSTDYFHPVLTGKQRFSWGLEYITYRAHGSFPQIHPKQLATLPPASNGA